MLSSRAVCWRCTSRLCAQAHQPVAKLAFSSLADPTPTERSGRSSPSFKKERKAPRHQHGTNRPKHAGARSQSDFGASAYDMFNQIVNANNTEWTGRLASSAASHDPAKTKAPSEIDITFMLSTLVARRNEPVQKRVETFNQSIWPHLQAYGTNMPEPLSQLVMAFIDGACRDEIHRGRPSVGHELVQVISRLAIPNLNVSSLMAMKMCHVLITTKNSTSYRNAMSHHLLEIWMRVSQMGRLAENGCPPRLVLPDEVEFQVALRNGQPSDEELIRDPFLRYIAFANALFPQFENGEAKELMGGLLTSLCILSDPRFVTEEVRREAAPLLKLASIFFTQYNPAEESIPQRLNFKTANNSTSFPPEKSEGLRVYIATQWHMLVNMLTSEKASWRQGNARDKFRTSLSGMHKRLRKAYQERNKPGVQMVWEELQQKLSQSSGLCSALQARPELMDYMVFVACALRLDHEFKTVLEARARLGMPLTLKTYTGMMHGWRLCKDTKKIDELWNQLERANVKLDVPIWTERLSAFVLKGKVGECINSLAALQKQWDDAVAANTVEESGAIQPSIEMVNACIKAILEIDPAAAKTLLGWAHNHGIRPDISTHNIILRRAFAAGPDEVAWVMDLMVKNQVEPNQATFVLLIEETLALTGADSPENQVAAVNQVFAELARSSVRIDAELFAKALHAVSSLANASDEAIDAVLHHVQEQNVRVNPYMVTILIERSLQREPRAFAPIRALLAKYGMLDISRGDQTLWERVIRAAACTGNPYVALDLFDDLAAAKRPVTSLPCLNDVLRALLDEGDAGNARRVVDAVLHNKLAQKGADRGMDNGRFWKHHFWYLAKANGLLDEENMPGGLKQLIEHY